MDIILSQQITTQNHCSIVQWVHIWRIGAVRSHRKWSTGGGGLGHTSSKTNNEWRMARNFLCLHVIRIIYTLNENVWMNKLYRKQPNSKFFFKWIFECLLEFPHSRQLLENVLLCIYSIFIIIVFKNSFYSNSDWNWSWRVIRATISLQT